MKRSGGISRVEEKESESAKPTFPKKDKKMRMVNGTNSGRAEGWAEVYRGS